MRTIDAIDWLRPLREHACREAGFPYNAAMAYIERHRDVLEELVEAGDPMAFGALLAVLRVVLGDDHLHVVSFRTTTGRAIWQVRTEVGALAALGTNHSEIRAVRAVLVDLATAERAERTPGPARDRAMCPVCRTLRPVLLDGTLKLHRPDGTVCPGSRAKP